MTGTAQVAAFDVERVRQDFPVLARTVHDKPLVYLDSAASALTPRPVIEAVTAYYARHNANIHRGVHTLSQEATEAYEGARRRIASFIGAAESRELIFCRGATEAINLVAQSVVRPMLQPGDEVLVTWLEHHSNIVPWQMICAATGATLVPVPIDDRGQLDLEAFDRLLGPRTRFAALSHVSNALGTINPVAKLIRRCHARGVQVLLDGAQALPHRAVDVHELDCDFYAFSGHKLFGPTGIGGLYGKAALLEAAPPWQGGGDMILSVSFEDTTYNELPYKFEAGTPHIAGGIGLGAAVAYLEELGMDRVAAYEAELLTYATEALGQVPGLTPIGTAAQKAAVLSFVLDGVHPHDVGTILDMEGIAVRTGHHCAEPAVRHFGHPGTVRASLAFYNTTAEVDALVAGLHKVCEMFR